MSAPAPSSSPAPSWSSALSWSAALDPALLADVAALLDACAEADGVEAVGEQVRVALARPGDGRPHLLAVVDGRVVGYAHVEARTEQEPAVVELAVHPTHRRNGLGRALLAAALRSAGDGARVWAHGDGAGARALAAAAGLRAVRELWQMRLDLTAAALPPRPARADVTLRTYAGEVDDAAVLAVNNAAFSWHPEQGGWTVDDLAERRGEAWFDPSGFFLAEDAATHELLGFHWTKVHPALEGEPALGEVYVVGIAPSAQGRGLGRLLTLVGLHHLHAAGLGAVLLYVEGDNDAAVHTYERLGFTRFHTDRAYSA